MNRIERQKKLNQAYQLAGKPLVNSVLRKYEVWKDKKSESNKVKYLRLRLNLHIKMNQWPDLLDLLDDELNLGLYDSEPGELYWSINI